jgi:hopanoid biosynthesis associated radical SAM protein HpnH
VASSRPLGLTMKLGWYLVQQKLKGRTHFPLTMILEPLEECNLTCTGCGRIREYEPIIDRKLTVAQCMEAVRQSDAPVVSIAGGEPLMHPDIGKIVRGIIREKRFVYLCTNALLYKRALKEIKPSPYFAFVVHLDGLRETHDVAVERKGVYDVAIRAIKEFRAAGFRVCTNTTLFNGNQPEEYHRFFAMLNDLGVEGMMVSPGFSTRKWRSTTSSCNGRRRGRFSDVCSRVAGRASGFTTTRCTWTFSWETASTNAANGRRPRIHRRAGGNRAI